MNIALVLTAVVVLGVLAHWLAWRLKLPAILFLLLIGIIAGPITGWVDPDLLYGQALFPVVSLSVAVILFEGSLTLRWSELKGIGAAVWGLVTVGAAITFVLIAGAAHLLMGIDWPIAMLIGAICSVTGPTVVVPILRAIRPKSAVSNALRWEGIIIDPIGAILAVLVVGFVRTKAIDDLWNTFALLLGAGLVCGFVAAWALAQMLRRHLIPWFLRDVVALALVLAAFVTANLIAHEAGLLAVTVMGMTLANTKRLNVEDILDFKESLTLLLVAVLFIVLAARLDFHEFSRLDWGLWLFLIAVMFVIRPIAVFVSTVFSNLSVREKLLISWIAPRGIVAASVASLFALELIELGVPGAELLVPVTFSVIIATVVLQSATAGRLARRLDLANPEPRGVLIVGAGAANRAFAGKLRSLGYTVTLADTEWGDVRRARMDGFQAYYGRVVSEHAEGKIDMGSIGWLFAMTERSDQNTLACLHWRPEIGVNAVFALHADEDQRRDTHEMPGNLQVGDLFGSDLTHGQWSRMIAEGAEFRSTRLTDEYGYRDWRKSIPGEFIALLGIDPRGRLHPFSDHSRPTLKEDWQVVSLWPRATVEAEAAAAPQRRRSPKAEVE